MPPFPIALSPRQNPADVITITGASTTSTIILGTGTVVASSAATTTASTVAAVTGSSSGPSQSTVVAAILGSFFGFIALCLLLWWCCLYGVDVRLFRKRHYSSTYYSGSRTTRSVSDSSSSSGSGSRSRVRVRVTRRGGGFGRRNERGHGVKIPARAEVRRERRGSAGTATTGTVRFERRRVARSAPVFGWWKPVGAVVETRRVRRDSWTGSGKSSGGERLKFVVDD